MSIDLTDAEAQLVVDNMKPLLKYLQPASPDEVADLERRLEYIGRAMDIAKDDRRRRLKAGETSYGVNPQTRINDLEHDRDRLEYDLEQARKSPNPQWTGLSELITKLEAALK